MGTTHPQDKTVYLITGASNGIGAAFIQILLSRPATTVIALHRSTSTLPEINPSQIHSTSSIIAHHYDANHSEAEVQQLANYLLTVHGVNRIDVVLAGAGMVDGMKPVLSTSLDEVQKHLDVNFGGPLKLVQGLREPLGLIKATSDKHAATGAKFILISSSVASLTNQEPVPGCLAYGASKAAANYLVTRLHAELAGQNLVAVAIHPGWVRTRMGLHAADEWNLSRDYVQLSPEDSAAAILKVVDAADRENSGGKFLNFDGSVMAW